MPTDGDLNTAPLWAVDSPVSKWRGSVSGRGEVFRVLLSAHYPTEPPSVRPPAWSVGGQTNSPLPAVFRPDYSNSTSPPKWMDY